MNTNNRTYSLDEAAEELHLDRETIERLLPKLGGGSQRAGDRLSEDQVNEIVDMLNNDPSAAPKQ